MQLKNIFANFVETMEATEKSYNTKAQWHAYIHDYMEEHNDEEFTKEQIDTALNSDFIIVTVDDGEKRHYGCFLSESNEAKVITDIIILKTCLEKESCMTCEPLEKTESPTLALNPFLHC